MFNLFEKKYYILKKNSEEKYFKGGLNREVEEVNAFLSSVKTSYDIARNEEDAYQFKSFFKSLLVKRYLGDNFVLIKIIHNQNGKQYIVHNKKKKYYILKKNDEDEYFKDNFNIEKQSINSFFSISEINYDTTKNEKGAYKFKSLLIALLVKRHLKDFLLIKMKGVE